MDIVRGAQFQSLDITHHFRLDQGFESTNLAIRLLLHELDFTESTLTNNLDCSIVFRSLFGPEESQILGFGTALLVDLLGLSLF
jgi:hypothetical protein